MGIGGCFSDFGITDEEGDAGLGAERLEIGEVGLVIAFLDAHMECSDGEARFVNLRPSSEQFGKQEAVFSSAEPDEHMVAVLEEVVIGAGLMKASCYFCAKSFHKGAAWRACMISPSCNISSTCSGSRTWTWISSVGSWCCSRTFSTPVARKV